jgi:hypothetical protein
MPGWKSCAKVELALSNINPAMLPQKIDVIPFIIYLNEFF